MSTKKYDVSFNKPAEIEPAKVYITHSQDYEGYFNIGILYVKSSSGSFSNQAGRTHSFDLKQGLAKGEEEAKQWAIKWLQQETNLVATLTENKT
ncbi:hypothetical protein V9657_004302 [Vibrio vulnificus]|uniref:hypothetical protein n=1 Tax=Vibrio vulnificus TaxID=672 RepID=UPI001028E10A|nr:hypothetical protein [Vibrio vulnificus]EGQ7997776.1 hypothetical protein [Vibrio vulnificus]EGQ8093314.1 hypothetical protein [Vibrio vulnificus]EHH0747127.1 hypothetical protein [Vibrio vulnificus]RZQ06013.1 hypothetical protein D8T39_21670 [Vibrio vulnificus]